MTTIVGASYTTGATTWPLTAPASNLEVPLVTTTSLSVGTYARIIYSLSQTAIDLYGVNLRQGNGTTGTIIASAGQGAGLTFLTDSSPVSQYTLTAIFPTASEDYYYYSGDAGSTVTGFVWVDQIS